MSEANYFIGYSTAKQLRPLTESERESAAVERLADFRGDENDVRLAAELFRRVGEGANAAELLRLVAPRAEVP
jgi:hypothetical protein